MRFLFLEPFYGGSHKNFADGWISHSKHEIELISLPARFWKWRMRGAALHFIERIPGDRRFDGIIATDLMSLADLKALWPGRFPPSLLYFHESQVSYPIPEGQERDLHFCLTDITSALTADRVLFNSKSHESAFFQQLPRMLRKMPEFRPMWVGNTIRQKSSVMYPGCQFPGECSSECSEHGGGFVEDVFRRKNSWRGSHPEQHHCPLIIWNHRWEFDKAPEVFFRTVDRLVAESCPFQLALLGENFQAVPKVFLDARRQWKDRIIQ